MTKKVYRSAQGKVVDLGALMLQNENTRAVGNMRVNARGDMLDSNNRSVASRNQQVKKQYNRQVAQPETQVPTSRRHARELASADVLPEINAQPEQQIEQAEPVIAQPAPVVETGSAPEGGLAAAIAKARQIKQEPLKTPRQQAQEKSGVNKI